MSRHTVKHGQTVKHSRSAIGRRGVYPPDCLRLQTTRRIVPGKRGMLTVAASPPDWEFLLKEFRRCYSLASTCPPVVIRPIFCKVAVSVRADGRAATGTSLTARGRSVTWYSKSG
jgi:hypothetical protein